jgi:hypothetical protein
LTSPFFFHRPPPKLKRLRFGVRSSGFLFPSDLRDRSVHHRGRCKSAESRINLLPGTPLRHCGVDETRDWFRHSKFEN